MPTIDELAPAIAATDGDEFPVNQNGITRKITRAQILAGLQGQVVLPPGSLLGRSSSGTGTPETISVGRFLSLSGGTLNSASGPYLISSSPTGIAPSGNDLVPIGQGGANLAVSYDTFIRRLSSINGVDGSLLLVFPSGESDPMLLADLAASVLLTTGGTMFGPVVLTSDPQSAFEAATKRYADTKVSRAGDTLTGPLYLAASPVSPSQAATKSYVDSSSAFPRSGFTMLGPITLAADPVSPLQSATKAYTDQRLLRGGDTMTGALGLAGDPSTRYQAATKNYVDQLLNGVLSLSGGSLSGPLLLGGDPAGALQAATRQYTDSKVSRSGDTLTGSLTLASDPAAALHAATKSYVDAQVQTALPTAGGTLGGALFLSGDPAGSSQAATKHYVDSALAAALPGAGGTVTGTISLLSNPARPTDATNKRYVDAQLSLLLPLTGGSLTGPLTLQSSPESLPGAAAIRLAAGQTIAMEASNAVTLGYNAASGAIVAKYGSTACGVGKGIAVATAMVLSSSAALSSASAGCMVLLTGNGAYTITLPLAASMTAGTGFTFSVSGAGPVSIVAASGDTVELAPVVLYQFDRYHVVSDGSSVWREVFKVNSVSPRVSGTPVLPAYSVANLPQTSVAGAKAFASNGRKPGESAGAGTGVEVFNDGVRWISVCGGQQVSA